MPLEERNSSLFFKFLCDLKLKNVVQEGPEDVLVDLRESILNQDRKRSALPRRGEWAGPVKQCACAAVGSEEPWMVV